MIPVKSGATFKGRRAHNYPVNVSLSTGANNDVEIGDASLIQVSVPTTADVSLTGMMVGGATPVDNLELFAFFDISNSFSHNFTLKHNDSGSAAGRRIYCPKRYDSSGRDIVITRGAWVHFIWIFVVELDADAWSVVNVSAD